MCRGCVVVSAWVCWWVRVCRGSVGECFPMPICWLASRRPASPLIRLKFAKIFDALCWKKLIHYFLSRNCIVLIFCCDVAPTNNRFAAMSHPEAVISQQMDGTSQQIFATSQQIFVTSQQKTITSQQIFATSQQHRKQKCDITADFCDIAAEKCDIAAVCCDVVICCCDVIEI